MHHPTPLVPTHLGAARTVCEWAIGMMLLSAFLVSALLWKMSDEWQRAVGEKSPVHFSSRGFVGRVVGRD